MTLLSAHSYDLIYRDVFHRSKQIVSLTSDQQYDIFTF